MPPPLPVNFSPYNQTMKPRLARFLVTYCISAKDYWFTMPGVSASHIWRTWYRPGSELLDVRECDANGLSPAKRLT